MQIRVTAHRRLTVSAGACIYMSFIDVYARIRACTRAYVYNRANSLAVYWNRARESRFNPNTHTRERFMCAISGITSIYPRYLRGKRSVFDAPISQLIASGWCNSRLLNIDAVCTLHVTTHLAGVNHMPSPWLGRRDYDLPETEMIQQLIVTSRDLME